MPRFEVKIPHSDNIPYPMKDRSDRYALAVFILSRIQHAVCSLIVVGPTETQTGIDAAAFSSGARNTFLFDNIFLPAGRVAGLEVYVDVNAEWSPFDLQIYRALGDPTTAESALLRYIGTATSGGINDINHYTTEAYENALKLMITFNETDYITVKQGDMYGILNTKTSSSLIVRFEAFSNVSMLVADYAINPVGSVTTFNRLINTGPIFFKVKVLVDDAPIVNTCSTTGNAVCQQACLDQPSGYVCQCNNGYTLNTDNITCTMNQTCFSHGNAVCQQLCLDAEFNFTCACHAGWILDTSDSVSCIANMSSLYGPPGQKGDKGAPGTTGTKGEKGSKGNVGAPGVQGQKGDQGPVGPKGTKGDKGKIGPVGSKGSTGQKGTKGERGEKGNIGSKGTKGSKGLQGNQGQPGDKGNKGTKGQQGNKGNKGEKGEVGLKGEKGNTGSSGPVGPKGSKGEKGNTGARGENGPAGKVGPQGEKGSKGVIGPAFVEIDECATNNALCEHRCVNSLLGYTCACDVGYVLDTNNKSCKDALECSVNNGMCQHRCVETAGGYTCSCSNGYILGSDRHTCVDINECAKGNLFNCDSSNRCVNVPGSYVCVPKSVAATGQCTKAEAQRLLDCDSGTGLLSRSTVIGFIVWLIILSLLIMTLLGCILYLINQRTKRRTKYHGNNSRRSLFITDDPSFYQSGTKKRLPEIAYYNYY